MKTLKGHVAVKEMKVVKEQEKAIRGLYMDDGLTNTLISTVVLLESPTYSVGTLLYFRSDIVRLPQARTKFKVNDIEFVLIPEDMIIGYDDTHAIGKK